MAARAAGCPEDLVRHFIAARVFLQPRQLAGAAAARLCDRANGATEGHGLRLVAANFGLAHDRFRRDAIRRWQSERRLRQADVDLS